MAQANLNNNTVSQVIKNGGSITVPSDEVWQVTLSLGDGSGQSDPQINDNTVWQYNGSERAVIENVILAPNDTISNPDGGGLLVSGIDISPQISNSPVSIIVSSGSTTVPSGETWEVDLLLGETASGQVDPQLDSESFYHVNGTGRTQIKDLVFTGGDTIGNPDGGNLWITGLRINE